jgi:uncharacterized protein (TIGR03437 family)
MDTLMCQRTTGEQARGRFAAILLLTAVAAVAQTPAESLRPNWRRIAGSTVDLALAGPATGPVSRVWFSEDGSRLYAQTASGRVFESADLENWSLTATPVAIPGVAPATAVRSPAAGARMFQHPRESRRIFALGAHLYRSDDGGLSWTNITAFGYGSVIGSGQHDLAISPTDPDLLIIANDYGVWRSADGGLSWSGLNQLLPNLPVRRILATPVGLAGARVVVEGAGLLEAQPGGDREWRAIADPNLMSVLEADVVRRRSISLALGIEITAAAGSGDILYAGASDGRIWISSDRGQTWRGSRIASGGAIENFYVDSQESRIALAVVAGKGAHVLRTINTGVTWDDISNNLPDVAARAIAVDRPSGAAYIATDGGLFYATVDMDRAGPAPLWAHLSSSLPAVPATDVMLDPGANQLYIALDGYGVFAAAAPHRARQMRVVNAADFSSRPAAPGSLVSVIGGRISRARAGELNFPILDANDGESQIQVPFEAVASSGSSISLALDSAGRQITFGVPFQAVSPSIFIDRAGAPMLVEADSGMMFDPRNAARSGSRIQILTTGLGRVRPDWPTGMTAPLQQPPSVRATVAAFLDRAPVEVLSATLAPGYVGLYLVEIRLPALVNAGPAELYITADGQESNRVSIQVEP